MHSPRLPDVLALLHSGFRFTEPVKLAEAGATSLATGKISTGLAGLF